MRFRVSFFSFPKGQILLETVVALGVLVMGILSVVSMSLIVLHSASVSGDRIIAVNLAREGIELVRLVRDTNWLDPANSWPYGLENNEYIVDSTSGDVLAIVGSSVIGDPEDVQSCGNACQLYMGADGRYTHTVTAQPTAFRRLITIENAAGTDVKQVIAEVAWMEGTNELTYRLESHLSDWREE